MKKGLAVVYDPHNLYQFVWYYCNRGKAKHWDALCLPNGYKGEYMHSYCEAAGIFDKVYRDDTDFSTLSAGKKLLTFLQMCGYFVLGRQKNFCRKLLNQYINCDDYDEMVVIGDMGVVSGACIALGQEKEVVILEDGVPDYQRRPKIIQPAQVLSWYSWQGFILASMGYCSPGRFQLKTNRNCIKYCSHPEKMKYRDYKELRRLYEGLETDQELFNGIVARIYPTIDEIDFENINAVLLTRPLFDYVINYKPYKERVERYISRKYGYILLKKHPREKEKYEFSQKNTVREVDNAIPAEALLSRLTGKEIILISASAILLYVKPFGLHCTILDPEGIYEESKRSNTMLNAPSLKEIQEFCDKFAEGYYTIEVI